MGAENFAPPGFDPRTFKPVASRYTGYAIPATLCINGTRNLLNGFKRSRLRVLKKVKFPQEQDMRAQRAVKAIDLLSALDEMERLVNATPRPLCPR